MLVEHFALVLWITGAITAAPVVQYVAPRPVLARMYRIELTEEAGLFFARHWGLLAASIGGLLMFAAAHPEARPAVVTAALVEKAGIVVAFAGVHRRPFARGLRLVAAFDAACVVLYGAWLVAS
jgi:multisubunit Na+/H+ antiporter MnhE subunit